MKEDELLLDFLQLVNKPILAWVETDIDRWLNYLNLGRWRRNFHDHHITGHVLLELDCHNLLNEMGIWKVGDRLRILISIFRLRQYPESYRDYVMSRLYDLQSATETMTATEWQFYDSNSAIFSSPMSFIQDKRMNIENSEILAHVAGKAEYLIQPRLVPDDSTPRILRQRTFRSNTSVSPSPPPSPSRKWPARAIVKPAHILLKTSTSASFITDLVASGETRRNSGSVKRFSLLPFSSSTKSQKVPHTSSSPDYGRGKPNSIRRQQYDSESVLKKVMLFESVRRRCVLVAGHDGTSHVINVSGLADTETIRNRIFAKCGIGPNDFTAFSVSVFLPQSAQCRELEGDELLAICSSDPPRSERNRLVVKRRANPLSSRSLVKLNKIFGRLPVSCLVSDRPPSDVISLNVEVFFPELGQMKSSNDGSPRDSLASLVVERRLCPLSNVDLRIVEACHPEIYADDPPLVLDDSPMLPSSSDAGLVHRLAQQTPNYDSIPDLDSQRDEGLRHWIKGDIIGSGSFSKVYYGVIPSTNEIVAVKQVKLPKTNESKSEPQCQRKLMTVAALEREIGLLKPMNHPHIVRYLGSFAGDGFLNVFLEYVSGGSIALMIAREGWLPFDEIQLFSAQILQGLGYLHSRNIIHRDLKGANVLVSTDKVVKISDFGVSKMMDSIAPSKTRFSMQGSVFWMAPELVRRALYDEKVDIWSLGCLVLEMLSGQHPWWGFDQVQAIYQIGLGKSTPLDHWKHVIMNEDLQSWNDNLPESAMNFLESCFIMSPSDRPGAIDLLNHSFLNRIPKYI